MNRGAMIEPVHMIFKKCFDVSREQLKEPEGLAKLMSELNRMLLEYRENKSTVNQINEEVNEVNQLMKQNISKVIERQESLESLMKRTEMLSESAREFQKQSKRLNRCCYLL